MNPNKRNPLNNSIEKLHFLLGSFLFCIYFVFSWREEEAAKKRFGQWGEKVDLGHSSFLLLLQSLDLEPFNPLIYLTLVIGNVLSPNNLFSFFFFSLFNIYFVLILRYWLFLKKKKKKKISVIVLHFFSFIFLHFIIWGMW